MASCKTINNSNLATHQIPLDVIIDILVWLPVKSLTRFNSVCKEWCTLINSTLFTHLQLNKTLERNFLLNRALFWPYKEYLCVVDDVYQPSKLTKLRWPKVTIGNIKHIYMVGSCNGLVCIRVYNTYPRVACFLIFNPSTRTFKSILPSSDKDWTYPYIYIYGFGYDSEHDDYKIVVTSEYWRESDKDLRIYSLKSGAWRYRTPNITGRAPEQVYRSVVYRNNMLHYLVLDEKYCRVARFDICSEEWRDDCRLPGQPKIADVKQFREADGNIYLCLYNKSTSVDIWKMEEYRAKDDYSWRMMFKIPFDFCFHTLVSVSKDERPRLLLREYVRDSLFWYDPQDDTRETFKVAAGKARVAKLCVASLVSIPGSSLTKMQEILE